MRKIKFRVWDGFKMYYPNYGLQITNECGNASIVQDFENCAWLDYNAKIQQFTGLLDKNGKEIYEGDIVEGFNTRMRYEIIWDEYEESHAQYVGFKLKCYDKLNNNKPFLSSFGSVVNQKLTKGLDNRFEVIGNIFENRNLLNEND